MNVQHILDPEGRGTNTVLAAIQDDGGINLIYGIDAPFMHHILVGPVHYAYFNENAKVEHLAGQPGEHTAMCVPLCAWETVHQGVMEEHNEERLGILSLFGLEKYLRFALENGASTEVFMTSSRDIVCCTFCEELVHA